MIRFDRRTLEQAAKDGQFSDDEQSTIRKLAHAWQERKQKIARLWAEGNSTMEVTYNGGIYLALTWYSGGQDMKQIAESYAKDLNESGVLTPQRQAYVVPATDVFAVQPMDMRTIEEWQSHGDWIVIA